jgi:hypothetical protein
MTQLSPKIRLPQADEMKIMGLRPLILHISGSLIRVADIIETPFGFWWLWISSGTFIPASIALGY